MASFKLAPPNLKAIQPYLKIAEEHEKRDPAITYWCRFYAVQSGLKINDKSPENTSFFIKLMDWLETKIKSIAKNPIIWSGCSPDNSRLSAMYYTIFKFSEKKTRKEDETVSNEVVALAHIENYALKLFLWADNEDRAGRFNKNVVKAFYTAGFIYDVVNTFGEPSEEVLHHRKYAKWKSTYIHNCLKNGETPIPGPMAMEGERDDEEDELARLLSVSGNPAADNPPSQPQAPYPTGGLFNMSTSQPEAFNLPVPGAHAPPSTPNGTNQLSPTTSITNICAEQENKGGVSLTPEDYHKAQKYCKWAGSALTYEDAPTAIENLQKALKLLTTGQDS